MRVVTRDPPCMTSRHRVVSCFSCPSCWRSQELSRSAHVLLNSGEEAKDRLRSRGIDKTNEFLLVASLKACTLKKDLCEGARLHADVLKQGLLGKCPHLASTLVSMYAKCGELAKAHSVLEGLPERSVVSWNALIAGYTEQGRYYEAFSCYEEMQRDGLYPDSVTFICILKACGKTGVVDKGQRIHDEIVSRGLLEKDVVLGNALIGMYAKCGVLAKARQFLETLPARDVITWNTLISAYAHQGQGHQALRCFEEMQNEGLPPDVVTFICVLKACGSTGAIDKGKQIHDMITNEALLGSNVVLGTTLVDMYARCGLLSKAQEVLEELPIRNTISWNVLITAYTYQGKFYEALDCFQQMQKEQLPPNTVTFICILKASGSIKDIETGIKAHDAIVKKGWLEKDIMLGNALVDMYVKFGMYDKAQEVLLALPVRDIVSWNSLITGYAEEGRYDDAMDCLEKIQSEGFCADAVTFTCIIQVCGAKGALDKGKQIHSEILDKELLVHDVILGTALVDMYAKCGQPMTAHKVLEVLPVRNVVSWSALIAGYAQLGNCHEALNCLEQLQNEGIIPNATTFLCILKACGAVGAIEKGVQIHDKILNSGLLKKEVVLGNALVDMYAKVGALEKATQALEGLHSRDLISWNTLIAGYAQQGYGLEALNCFQWMQTEGILPDDVTFLCVLAACSHSGLLDEAQILFGSMGNRYGVTPNLVHHTCMMVIFGCAGQFEKALSVIEAMPSSNDPGTWLALLGSCRKWGNVKFARLAFDQAVQLDSSCAAAYILMADIFTAAGMWEDAEKTKALRVRYAASKEHGDSTRIDARSSFNLLWQ